MRGVRPATDRSTRGTSDSVEVGWLAGMLPERLAVRGLAVDVQVPDTISLGSPSPFTVVVYNRLPVPVEITLPTSRLWGWSVDDVPEADSRGYEPPSVERSFAFNRGQQRTFTATWDGRIRERGTDGDVWRNARGKHTITGYLAVENWRERGLYSEKSVDVV